MPKLTICIPTFNRAAMLEANLTHLTDLASRHDFLVQVSDNSSTDMTRDVAVAAAQRCSRIRYHRNLTNIGMDGNFATALALADTSYAWLMGDDDFVTERGLSDVLELLESEVLDLILVNGGSESLQKGRVRGEPSRDFNNPEQFLKELGWHATWISGLVIGERLRNVMRVTAYDGSYFSHFIALFEALLLVSSPRIRWHAAFSFHSSHLAEFSWTHRVLEIFATRWSKAVWSIPGDYTATARRTCIAAHGLHTRLLTGLGLLNMRALGGLDLTAARENRVALSECSPLPWSLIVAICLVPRPVARLARSGARGLKSVMTATRRRR